MLLWIILTVWMLIVALSATDNQIQKEALDVIEALQGIFTVVIFVSDRYTRKELQKKFQTKSRTCHEMESILRKDFGGTVVGQSTITRCADND